MHINDQHLYTGHLYQTRVENTKNSFSPFTKDLLTIKYSVIIIRNLYVHRLNPSLASRQISSRRGRFIASGLGENCGPARNRWKLNACEYPLLSWRTMPSTFAKTPFPNTFFSCWEFPNCIGNSTPSLQLFVGFFFFNLREGRGEGTREICSIWTESRWIWFGEFFRSIVGIVSNKYGGGRGTRCFKREIN